MREVVCRWQVAYETLLFDTPSGDLEPGFYADLPDNWQFRPPGDPAKSQWKVIPKRQPIDDPNWKPFDPTGFQKANVIGKEYYAEFADPETGECYRDRIAADDYLKIGTVPGYRLPSKRITKVDLV